MTRNLKALGLALIAAFALSAMAASAASAADLFTSDSANEKTAITGSGNKGVELRITGEPEDGITCTHETYFGTTTSNSVSSVTLSPTYTGCESATFGAITFDMNGCDYDLTGDTTGEDPTESGKIDATVSLTCPEGKEVTTTGGFGCTFHIHPQTPTHGGAVYTNGTGGGKKDITVDITATGLTYKSSFACQLAGFPSEANDLDLIGTMTLTGYEDKKDIKEHEYEEGALVNIEVSGS